VKDAFMEGNGGGREATGGLEIRTWSAPACVREKNGACKRKKREAKERERKRKKGKRSRGPWQVHPDPPMSPSRCAADETCENLHLTFYKY